MTSSKHSFGWPSTGSRHGRLYCTRPAHWGVYSSISWSPKSKQIDRLPL